MQAVTCVFYIISESEELVQTAFIILFPRPTMVCTWVCFHVGGSVGLHAYILPWCAHGSQWSGFASLVKPPLSFDVGSLTGSEEFLVRLGKLQGSSHFHFRVCNTMANFLCGCGTAGV